MLIMTVVNARRIRVPRNGRDLTATVAVLLPVRNEAENVVDLVASLKAQTGIPDLKFYFLDDIQDTAHSSTFWSWLLY